MSGDDGQVQGRMNYPSRWFECPCGAEFWDPDCDLQGGEGAQLDDPVYLAEEWCPMCSTRPMRELLFALGAGSASSAFVEDDASTVDRGVWSTERYVITVERIPF